jgi:hypothetical protein
MRRRSYKAVMSGDTSTGGWMVEVLGDGRGPRHRRFMVGAPDSTTAVKLVIDQLGSDTVITSSSAIEGPAYELANVKLGEVVPI